MTQLGGAPIVLRNEGGNKNNWMSIDLKALNDNKSGIGTKVELYAGMLYQKWEVAGASGYLGAERGADSCGAGHGEERGSGAVAVADGRAAGRNQSGGEESAINRGTGPARAARVRFCFRGMGASMNSSRT